MEGENNQNGSNGGAQNAGQNMNNNNGPVHNDPVKDFASGNNNNTLLAVVSYIGPLVVFSYLMGKDNDFVRFHAKQGMVVFGLEIVMWVLGSMMYSMWFILNLVNLATLVLSIIGIVNAVQGHKKELPIVGGLAKNVNF